MPFFTNLPPSCCTAMVDGSLVLNCSWTFQNRKKKYHYNLHAVGSGCGKLGTKNKATFLFLMYFFYRKQMITLFGDVLHCLDFTRKIKIHTCGFHASLLAKQCQSSTSGTYIHYLVSTLTTTSWCNHPP